MKGDSEVLRLLGAALASELTAVDQYLAHGRLHAHWGFTELAEKLEAEIAGERADAAKLVERILFLEGVPDVARRNPMSLGADPVAALESDLVMEHAYRRFLDDAIARCREVGDHGSEELLREILAGEEEHIDWIETQLDVVRRVGRELYLSRKL